MLDVGGHDAEQSHPLDVHQRTCLLAGLLELERVEGLVELVYLGRYLGVRKDSHVVVERDPVQLHSNGELLYSEAGMAMRYMDLNRRIKRGVIILRGRNGNAVYGFK